MVEIKLVKYREKREELLGLFQVSFGLPMSVELWNWKYLQNPLAPAVPELIVATDKGKIVGIRPFLFAELWLGNERVKAAQPCDSMVHPEYRREGIFSQMNQFAIEYCRREGYTLFYNFPNSKSRPGFLRQGWKTVSVREELCRYINPQKLIAHKLKSRLGGCVLGFLYDKLLNTRLREVPLSSSPFQIKVSAQFTDELKEVDALRDKTAIDLVRSESYLKWRFDQHPEHKYEYVVLKKGKELWGYAVLGRQEQGDGQVYGVIVDYLVKDEDIDCFRLLMNECLNELKQAECALAFVWAFTQPRFRKEFMERFGFKSPMKFPYSRFLGKGYFVARKVSEQAVKTLDIYDEEKWRVTHAYPDWT